MKNIADLNKRKSAVLTIDNSLKKYIDMVINPKKLVEVNNLMKKAKLPRNKNTD